jgi:uncharacterized protein YllA (UPF0747 family)
MQIMKPYAPLGILYLCSHLRQHDFDVEVFDTTFSSREALFHHLRTEKPSMMKAGRKSPSLTECARWMNVLCSSMASDVWQRRYP